MLLYTSRYDSFLHCTEFSVNGEETCVVERSSLCSVLHSPITAIHQGRDFYTIAIGYETGEVVVGILDSEILEKPEEPYGSIYLPSKKVSLRNEFVELKQSNH